MGTAMQYTACVACSLMQVMGDFVVLPADHGGSCHPDDKYRSRWRCLAEGVLSGASLQNLEKATMHRKAAQQQLSGIGKQLVLMTGRVLSNFIWAPEDQQKALQEGKVERRLAILAYSLDQGFIGYGGCWYLQNHCSLLMNIVPDPSHRSPNDCKLALNAVGQRPLVVAHTLCLNMHHGPWASEAWWCKLQEAPAVYFRMNAGTAFMEDPLFQHMVPSLPRDFGMESQAHEPDVLEHLWARCSSRVEGMGINRKQGLPQQMVCFQRCCQGLRQHMAQQADGHHVHWHHGGLDETGLGAEVRDHTECSCLL